MPAPVSVPDWIPDRDAGCVAGPLDADLARRATGGDADAFSALAGRHKTWLFRFIRRYVGSDADAFDLLQDTMVATWLTLRRYDPGRPFQAWLRQIALNKCRDWHRRSVLRRIVGFLSGDLDTLPAEAGRSNPETMWMASETLQQLDSAIASLPRPLREPFILIAFEGLSYRETARMLQVSEKAVETRVYRARQRLSRVIAKSDLTLLIQGAAAP
jgi:RNA polymerase sigma-70 factor (ECF subfamily)